MLLQLSSTLEALNDMTEKLQFVSNKTQALHEACEQLVQEQVHADMQHISHIIVIQKK